MSKPRVYGLTYYRRWHHGTTTRTPPGRYASEAAALKRARLLFEQMCNVSQITVFRTNEGVVRVLKNLADCTPDSEETP